MSARRPSCSAGSTASGTTASCCSSTCVTARACRRACSCGKTKRFKVAEAIRLEIVDRRHRAGPARDRRTINPEIADRGGRGRGRARFGYCRRRDPAVSDRRERQEFPRSCVFGTAISICGAGRCTRTSDCARRVIAGIRRRMRAHGFWEIETPILKSSRPRVRATIWCRAGFIPGSSTRCRSRRSCSSRS